MIDESEPSASNYLSAGEVIRELEEMERSIDLLNRQKSRLYKTADAIGHSVEAIRQVLHYRREQAKSGRKPDSPAPSDLFTQYLAEVDQ